jgi:hypothetical protein
VAQAQLDQARYTNGINQGLVKKNVAARVDADMSLYQVAIDEA